MSVTSRTEDSAIDMELSVLSNVPEEDEPQEKDTLIGSYDNLKIEIPVPRELEMALTPRIPRKSFADIKDPPSTSTPAPVSQSKEAKSGRLSRRKEGDGTFENHSDLSEIVPEEKDMSNASEDACECDEDVAPKTRGQFMLFLAVIALSVITGFLAGYFLREVKYDQDNVASLSLKEDEACLVSRIPTSLTAKQLQYQDQAMSRISKDNLMQYARMFSTSPCMSGTPCAQNLTDNLVTKLKDLGHSNVVVSTYKVLVSLPDLTQPSTLRTKDVDGNVLHTVHLYGGDIAAENSTKSKLSSGGANSPAGNINKRSVIDATSSSSSSSSSLPMYVPYSASKTVEGDLIYVNCARTSDFAVIDDLGIDLTGRIAIARRCGMMAMQQVKNVEKEGMVGLLLYNDPADMSLPIVQSSMDLSMGMSGMYGDPLTPGCPAMEGIHRMTDTTSVLPTIPVQTVTTDVALRLLSNITGKEAPADWHGGLNITYHVGRKSRTPIWTVEMEIHNTMEQQDIHNVMLTIPGTDYPDEYVLMGAHYTSMMTDVPDMSTATGSVSMAMDTATVLAGLLSDGWEPKRTIVLGLWEGAEMANVGSMEWVEEHQKVLADRAVAYIDLDTMMGPGMKIVAETSPLLMGVIMDAADQLELTDVVTTATLDGMGDHVPFSHMLGIPSVSFHTTPANKDSIPVPNLDVSTTMLATKTLLLLADDPMIRYDGFSLVEMVMEYVDNLETQTADMMAENNMTMVPLKQTAIQYVQNVLSLEDMVDKQGMLGDPVTMTMINDRSMSLEKSLVVDGTTDTMRHILYGSQQMETFSIMMDVLADDDVTMETVQEMLTVVQCILQSATTSLALTLL